MDRTRWERVAVLFADAGALPAADRDAFLAAACGGDADLMHEVQSLLAADGGDAQALDRGFHQAITELTADGDATPSRPARVGPYLLGDEIGRGGMGTVYLATRDDEFEHRVAIKVVRGLLDDEGVRRFRAERQILATLQHPSIATLLDGGSTPEGLPYLVMEYVDGVPIDAYCRDRGLTVRQRLELFCRVCDAVAHAHRHLVVHRDLKPSNILVTAGGTPKLLDFGIAKLLDPSADALQTRASMRVLTPEYASPEQQRGEPITTAADVYSLGVLLFELLTGSRPLAETTRSGGLAADLDTIIQTALREEPERRYPSVDQFADDVRRYLGGHPVAARPSTWTYRTRRFVQRHRAGVATAAVFVVMVVAFGVALAVSTARANRERAAAERVTEMLIQMFSGSDPRTVRGNTITARELLDQGADRIRRELRDQPAVQTRLLDSLGAIYLGLGMPDRAQGLLQDSMRARGAAGVVDSQPAARTMWRLAVALNERGQPAAAEPLARGAYEMTRRLVGPVNPQSGETLNTLAQTLHALGRSDEAEAMLLEATQIFRETLGPEHPMVGNGLQNTARVRIARGDMAGAGRLLEEALVIQRRIFGHATGESLLLLGKIAAAQGRPAESEARLREALAAHRAAYGATPHPVLLQAFAALASQLRANGQPDEAAALDAEAARLRAR